MARKSYNQMIADNIATRWLKAPRWPNAGPVRDYVDAFTDGELDRVKLDILTDMVSACLESATERDRLLAAARRPHGH